MSLFQTLIHPTDFDAPSREAFRVARSLAQALGARVVAFHLVAPPALVTQDGRVILDPKVPEPVDLWAEYRALQAETPQVPVQYAVVVGNWSGARQLLEAKIRELGDGVLVVMGSHGRTGLRHFFWGSLAEDLVRQASCAVLVVKKPERAPTDLAGAEATAGA